SWSAKPCRASSPTGRATCWATSWTGAMRARCAAGRSSWVSRWNRRASNSPGSPREIRGCFLIPAALPRQAVLDPRQQRLAAVDTIVHHDHDVRAIDVEAQRPVLPLLFGRIGAVAAQPCGGVGAFPAAELMHHARAIDLFEDVALRGGVEVHDAVAIV